MTGEKPKRPSSRRRLGAHLARHDPIDDLISIVTISVHPDQTLSRVAIAKKAPRR